MTGILAAPASVHAESFRVPPGPLAQVIAQLGRQAATTIVLADPLLAERVSPGVQADVPLAAALERALRGTGAEARFIAPSVVQVRRRQPARPAPRPDPPRVPAAPPPAQQDIVVTASKQALALGAYPGSVKVIATDRSRFASQAAEGSAAITRLSPTLASTNLGRGRNKLFIRGIADSSFSGPTQTTTGQYLGDVRLTYSAPDPDLNLYDMQGIEVLAGPQGTLYGSGSLGGIIRLVPHAPSLEAFSLGADSGIGFTRHGNASFDGAVMVNAPLAANMALRGVFYGGRAGGYIDAPEQDRRNINETKNTGQRLTLRLEDIGAWTIDIGTALQNFRSDDGQYVLRGEPSLTRSGSVAQPYQNNYRLGFVIARRPVGTATLTSVSAVSRQDLSTVFDASGHIAGSDRPTRLKEAQRLVLLSQELRLAGGDRSAPWVAGFALVRSVSRRRLAIGSLAEWSDSAGLQDNQLETALFAQASRPVLPALAVTAGLRLTGARSNRRAFDIDPDGFEGRTGRTRRLSGTLGLVWRPAARTDLFMNLRQGYRPGGLGFTVTDDALQTRQFKPDDLRMIEWGVRWGDAEAGVLSIDAALFLADWRGIQADLVGPYAIPYTANIGRGIIHGLDAELVVRPAAALTFTASGFFNRSRLRDAASAIFEETASDRTYALPNVPKHGARLAATWERVLDSGSRLRLEAAFRYVGPSRLGVGSYLDIPQGDYAAGNLSANVERGRIGLTLDIENLTDSRGNTFSYGNPFGISERRQWTPLRPRTVRLGLHFLL